MIVERSDLLMNVLYLFKYRIVVFPVDNKWKRIDVKPNTFFDSRCSSVVTHPPVSWRGLASFSIPFVFVTH